MIIKAETGYSIVLLRKAGPQQVPWDKDLVRRYPVVAWEYGVDGSARPLLPFPTGTDEFVLELPDGKIVGFRATDPHSLVWADDIDRWLGYMEQHMLSQVATEGSA